MGQRCLQRNKITPLEYFYRLERFQFLTEMYSVSTLGLHCLLLSQLIHNGLQLSPSSVSGTNEDKPNSLFSESLHLIPSCTGQRHGHKPPCVHSSRQALLLTVSHQPLKCAGTRATRPKHRQHQNMAFKSKGTLSATHETIWELGHYRTAGGHGLIHTETLHDNYVY